MKIIETGDGSGTLFSERYNETFHSTNGAVTESRHVFLSACGVADRLRTGQPTRVLEIGFGLGLNALITADAAKQYGTRLAFHSLEHDAGMRKQAQRLNYDEFLHDPTLGVTVRQALARRAENASKTDIDMGGEVTIVIHWRNAVHSLSTALLCSTLPGGSPEQNDSDVDFNDTVSAGDGLFNAVYLDAFSPDTNPECWSEEFFRSLKPLMASTARLSTYSAKGSVRRALLAAGFAVNKIAGPPGKREMLVARPIISAFSQSADTGDRTSP